MAWVNPRFKELTGKEPPRPFEERQAGTAEPPAERGQRLATLKRQNRDKPDEELRVSLDQYQGHDFISVRLWAHDPKSGFWPVKGKGISIRLREAEAVSAALLEAIRLSDQAETQPAAPSRGAGSARGRQPSPARNDRPELPLDRPAGGRFDEFADQGELSPDAP
jgi:hypothetical protein